MSKRISLGRIVAASVIAAVAAIGPVQAVSAEPFRAGGEISTIDDGDVKAAGASGRFIVRNRHVGGTIAGVIGTTVIPADRPEPFTFTFKTNVPIQTQSGNIQGRLEFGPYEAKVIGMSQLGVTPVPCPAGWEAWCVPGADSNLYLPGLLITGTATFTEGAEGGGTVSAFIVPKLTPEGHIDGIIAAGLTIVGE
jgi:hypothetical protein